VLRTILTVLSALVVLVVLAGAALVVFPDRTARARNALDDALDRASTELGLPGTIHLPTAMALPWRNGTTATSTSTPASAAASGGAPTGTSTASDAGSLQTSAPDRTGRTGTATSTTTASSEAIGYPRSGSRRYRVAGGNSPVAGRGGQLLRYRVVVEKEITGITTHQFAARVVQTLSDARSWVGTGKVRLQRVSAANAADFTIYLVTPQTRDVLCDDTDAGDPDRYTSCRNGDRVVLNVARWVHGVPGYAGSLQMYRTYMINHETGHRLGHQHETCPAKGHKAPVMQQQTLGLHGCTPNAWPRVNGRLYQGPAGSYDDPIPDA